MVSLAGHGFGGRMVTVSAKPRSGVGLAHGCGVQMMSLCPAHKPKAHMLNAEAHTHMPNSKLKPKPSPQVRAHTEYRPGAGQRCQDAGGGGLWVRSASGGGPVV